VDCLVGLCANHHNSRAREPSCAHFEAESFRSVVMGENYMLAEGKETIEGTPDLDPDKKPKQIDAVRTQGLHKGETLRGVYYLSEDSLVVCFAVPGKDRLTKIKAGGEPGLRVRALKRERK